MIGARNLQESRRLLALQQSSRPPPTLGDLFVDWNELALTQGPVTCDTFVGKNGLLVALEDDCNSTQENWRRILVRVETRFDEVHVFDRNGYAINEPSRHVEHGRQSMEKFMQLFDAIEGGYRSPVLRRGPRNRDSPAARQTAASRPGIQVQSGDSVSRALDVAMFDSHGSVDLELLVKVTE